MSGVASPLSLNFTFPTQERLLNHSAIENGRQRSLEVQSQPDLLREDANGVPMSCYSSFISNGRYPSFGDGIPAHYEHVSVTR
jgi:hypothetical protein